MRRRRFLATAGSLSAIVLAGCSDGPDREAAAQAAVDRIDAELEVVDWLVDENQFYLEYVSSGEAVSDVELVGPAYADAVDDGVNVRLDGVAHAPDREETAYFVTIQLEWALEYLDGEISEEEYLGRIANSVE